MLALESIKVIGMVAYLNKDPAMPFRLPLNNCTINEMAEAICRACVDYELAVTWEAAKNLALAIGKSIVKDSLKGDALLRGD